MKVMNELSASIVALRGKSKRAASPGKVGFALQFIDRHFRTRLRLGDEGNTLVEIALVLPILLIVLTGIASVGTAFMNYEALTNGVAQGAQVLSTSRTSTLDPCADVFAAIRGVAPTLNPDPANLKLTLTLNGTVVSGNTCSGKQSLLLPNTNVTVNATYPCNLGVYGVSFAPCTLSATLTEAEN